MTFMSSGWKRPEQIGSRYPRYPQVGGGRFRLVRLANGDSIMTVGRQRERREIAENARAYRAIEGAMTVARRRWNAAIEREAPGRTVRSRIVAKARVGMGRQGNGASETVVMTACSHEAMPSIAKMRRGAESRSRSSDRNRWSTGQAIAVPATPSGLRVRWGSRPSRLGRHVRSRMTPPAPVTESGIGNRRLRRIEGHAGCDNGSG